MRPRLTAFLITLAVGLTGVSGQAAASSIVQANICQTNKPVIISPPDNGEVSTNDTILSGQADARTTITVNGNGQIAGTTSSTDNGAFSVAITLQTGPNVIYLQAENACGQKTLSAPFTINKVPKKQVIFAPVLEPLLRPLPDPIEEPITEILDITPSFVVVSVLGFIVCMAAWIGSFVLRRLYTILINRKRRSKAAYKKPRTKPRK